TIRAPSSGSDSACPSATSHRRRVCVVEEPCFPRAPQSALRHEGLCLDARLLCNKLTAATGIQANAATICSSGWASSTDMSSSASSCAGATRAESFNSKRFNCRRVVGTPSCSVVRRESLMSANETGNRADRLGGLRRFAVAITVLNILGHAFFGFEQSFAQPVVAVVAAYSTELLLEFIDARCNRRALRFWGGGPLKFIAFLLSAHITGLACAMLLYANERLGPVIFASVVAICSKAVLRVPAGKGTRHFFNPSNLGITATLLAFSWVSVAPPYQFTENMIRF